MCVSFAAKDFAARIEEKQLQIVARCCRQHAQVITKEEGNAKEEKMKKRKKMSAKPSLAT